MGSPKRWTNFKVWSRLLLYRLPCISQCMRPKKWKLRFRAQPAKSFGGCIGGVILLLQLEFGPIWSHNFDLTHEKYFMHDYLVKREGICKNAQKPLKTSVFEKIAKSLHVLLSKSCTEQWFRVLLVRQQMASTLNDDVNWVFFQFVVWKYCIWEYELSYSAVLRS